MRRAIRGAASGLFFAGIAALVAYFNGFNSGTLAVFLYLYVALGMIGALKAHLVNPGGLKDLLHSIVIVVEGEELKMKKLFTGEKYRLDGEVEKLQ